MKLFYSLKFPQPQSCCSTEEAQRMIYLQYPNLHLPFSMRSSVKKRASLYVRHYIKCYSRIYKELAVIKMHFYISSIAFIVTAFVFIWLRFVAILTL